MYTYFKGYIIREGGNGLDTKKLKDLYVDAGWIGKEEPSVQDERFHLVFENSTWAYTVWDHEELVGMVRVISDKIMYATILDLVVKGTHQGKGIGKELVRLCVQKMPHGTWYAHTSSNNHSFYKSVGFQVQDVLESANCVYYGRRRAREEGHR